MKTFSFNERVDKCIARFNDVEARATEQGERHGLHNHARPLQKAKEPTQKA